MISLFSLSLVTEEVNSSDTLCHDSVREHGWVKPYHVLRYPGGMF